MEVMMSMAAMMEETAAMMVAAVMEGMEVVATGMAATVTVATEVVWTYRVYLAESADVSKWFLYLNRKRKKEVCNVLRIAFCPQ
jgi:hypothetical protein